MVVTTLYKLSCNTNGRSMESVPDYKFWEVSNNRSLLEFVRSVVQYYLHVDVSQLNGPQYWKTKILVDSSKLLTSKNHFPNIRENQWCCAIPGCKSPPRTYCEECDVALCVKDHFKLFQSQNKCKAFI